MRAVTELPPPSIDQRRARWIAITLGLGTLGALAAAIATLDPTPRRGSPQPGAQRSERLEAALVRCQSLGDAAIADASCRAAWAEHRRRFMAREQRP